MADRPNGAGVKVLGKEDFATIIKTYNMSDEEIVALKTSLGMPQPKELNDGGQASPDVGAAVSYAATVLAGRSQLRAAIAMTMRALAKEPLSASIWANLGSYLFRLERYDEAERMLVRALEIDPVHVVARATLALVNFYQWRFAEAESNFNRSLKLRPDNLLAKWDQALFHLSTGDWQRGLDEYEVRIPRKGETYYPKLPMPVWNGEPLEGKTIYVRPEQGIGDAILYSRFLPWLKSLGPKIVTCNQPSVMSLLWGYRDLVTFVPQGVPEETLGADYVLHMNSLAHRFGLRADNLPADPGFIKRRIAEVMPASKIDLPEPSSTELGADTLKVGIVWSGNPAMEENEARSVPLDILLELVTLPNVWLYSFQVGPAANDIVKIGADKLICDLSQQCAVRGLAPVGEALTRMDAVVTCCTSVAHLAGALDVPTMLMLNRSPFWYWGHNDSVTTPWYPSVRLFRQPQPKDWPSVIAAVRRALIDMAASKATGSPAAQ